jgi:hypothetical protein
MPRTAILFGVLLVALGLGEHWGKGETWLVVVAAVMGVAILVLGVAALINRSWRQGAMHAAVIVGLVGFVATASALYDIASIVLQSPNLLARSTMAILCGVFVVLSLKSFLMARLGRQETPPVPAAEASQEPKN